MKTPCPSWIDLGPGGSKLPHLSLSDSLRANGDRHWENAARYIEAGNFDYAMGSLRKAGRNYERANEIDDICSGRLR